MEDVPLTYPKPAKKKLVDSGGPFLIGVAGGASSGKQFVCQMIMDRLVDEIQDLKGRVATIRLYDFYKPLSATQKVSASKGDYNFDHPDAFDIELLESCIKGLVQGKSVCIPRYDFGKYERLASTETIMNPDVIIIEGILMFYTKEMRDLLSLKVFVDVDSDVRLARQVIRDTSERFKKDLDQILRQYCKFVKPSFEDYISPSKKWADVVIPRGSENVVAIDLLAHHIVDILTEKQGIEQRNQITRVGSSTEILRDSPVLKFNEILH